MNQGPGGTATPAGPGDPEHHQDLPGEHLPRPDLPPPTRRRVPRMVARRVGEIWLVHPVDELDQRSWMFAAGLARDPELTLVVIDIPESAPEEILQEVARALPLGAKGLRLVFGRTPPGGSPAAGRWLSSRLGKVVVTAVGRPWPTADGALFVSSDRGPGWMRYHPAGDESWEARRFPKPEWESDLHERLWQVTERTWAEPIAAGVWLRPTEETAPPDRHRSLLMARLPSRTDSITVVVGTPGTVAVPLDDVTRFWWTLPEHARPTTRFVCFGPVELPPGRSFGEALAESVDAAVPLYNGLPTTSLHETRAGDHPVLVVRDDGTLGRPLMAREIVQLPAQRIGDRQLTLVTDHRWPLHNLPLVRPGIYRYGQDMVLEVMRIGLWIHGVREPAYAPHARSAPVDDKHELVLCDGGDAQALPDLLRLAERIAREVSSEQGVPVRLITVQEGPDGSPAPFDEVRAPAEAAASEPEGMAAEASEDVSETVAVHWLRATYGHRYEESTAFVAALLHRHPSLRGGQSSDDTVRELVALRLRLLGEGLLPGAAEAEDGRLREELTRSVVAGLRRLPAFRGPVTLRVTLGEADLAWYAARRTVTEEGCCTATFSGTSGRPGNTDLLILSANGRRTALLEVDDPGCVLFLPGTRFAVLRVERGERNVVLLRELVSPDEETNPDADQSALQKLKRALLDWQHDEIAGMHPSGEPGPRFRPPGLTGAPSASRD